MLMLSSNSHKNIKNTILQLFLMENNLNRKTKFKTKFRFHGPYKISATHSLKKIFVVNGLIYIYKNCYSIFKINPNRTYFLIYSNI